VWGEILGAISPRCKTNRIKLIAILPLLPGLQISSHREYLAGLKTLKDTSKNIGLPFPPENANANPARREPSI
jgi:hypothetical protein